MGRAINRLRTMMKSYEGPRHTVVALALGGGGCHVISSGSQMPDTSADRLIFEIGSITKVFSAILLHVLVEEGRIDPYAPLRDLSGALTVAPRWITPESLTSHTSGLPRIHVPLWKALIDPLPQDPYAEFSRANLLAWLRERSRRAPPRRRRHAYSNLGIGLLGEAMAMREGKSFTALLTEKVIAPLGLRDTTDRLDGDQNRRFVQPRDTKGRAVVPWTFQAMAAAGCIRSSAHDMARFARRVLQALKSPEAPLDRAIRRSTMPILGLGPRGAMAPTAQCSGWLSLSLGEAHPRILHHDGGTAGSTCAIYICPERERAIAILSNNGIAANLWASTKLSWSNQIKQANTFFAASGSSFP